jgi:uncharacterized phage-associated protein
VYEALAVANSFLDIASGHGKTLGPMKIQKLVYYAHGWNLAINDAPLINEYVEAWEYGPVIPSVYHAFKKYGSGAITEKGSKVALVDHNTIQFITPTVSDAETLDLLNVVWDGYGDLSAIQLSNLTHEPGSPWSQTHAKSPGRKGVDIPDELIKEYFVAKSGTNAVS